MPFLYLRDPLFLVCIATYLLNRFVFKRIWDSGFAHEHLNDLICIPFWVPIMLFVQRRVGLRESDDAPHASELIIPLVIWSWVFEIILPRFDLPGTPFIADYLDIVYYALGALVAAIIWRWWYRKRDELGPENESPTAA